MGYLLSAFLASGGTASSGATSTSKEYQVKAVFLFHLAQFVTWPSSAFTKSDGPFTIGVLGKDPFGPFLDETVRGERVGERPLVVRRYRHPGEVKECQVLFISASERGRIEGILGSLRGRGILTVGDFDGFASKGGVIRFVTVKGKVRFKVNLEAAKMDRLAISSRVLRVAEIVRPGKD